MASDHRVVIIGGGFAGLHAAQSLNNAPLRVTLIDRRNFHLFQPLLYQVATGWLSPANIASTLRSVLKHQKNARVLLAEALDFDVEKREVILDHGTVAYDTLIVGGGPTSVELAGALGEIARDTLRNDFRNIDPAAAEILLLETADRILTPYPPELAKKAENFLSDLGVTVQTNAIVTAIDKDAVTVQRGG